MLIISTNTSNIPITHFTEPLKHGRFLGLHWAQAHLPMPFSRSSAVTHRYHHRRIPISNRRRDLGQAAYSATGKTFAVSSPTGWCMQYREDSTWYSTAMLPWKISIARHRCGSLDEFCGMFRYMDLTGLQAYYHVMNLFLLFLRIIRRHLPFGRKNRLKAGGNGILMVTAFAWLHTGGSEEWGKTFRRVLPMISMPWWKNIHPLMWSEGLKEKRKDNIKNGKTYKVSSRICDKVTL